MVLSLRDQFPHNPEPFEKHLTEIIQECASGNYDMGIVVDPDVDRLAFVDEKGKMFGEEYTLVLVADYSLRPYKEQCGEQFEFFYSTARFSRKK